MSTRTAELVLTQTSETCTRYALVSDGKVIWRRRAFTNTPASHQAARERMVAWATAHDVEVVEATPEPAPAQAIVPGRYGRH